ncbi:MAG: DUF2500 family protein [Clostridia bacterium]|nr:DUF2500 family protein [Clostridia bacterium]
MIHLLLSEKGDLTITLTLIIGGVIMLGLLIYLFAVEVPKSMAKERVRREQVLKEYEKEPEYKFVKAQVLSKEKEAYYVGIKLSKLVEEYYIHFLTEDGDEMGLRVRQDVFEKIEEGQEGTLVTVNGNFFDFGDGVDVETFDGEEEQSEEQSEE